MRADIDAGQKTGWCWCSSDSVSLRGERDTRYRTDQHCHMYIG